MEAAARVLWPAGQRSLIQDDCDVIGAIRKCQIMAKVTELLRCA
jgi:hypothetical protein